MFNQLTEKQTAVLNWMDEVCGQALKEARENRSLALLEHLSKHAALAYYIQNVATRGVMTREQFAQQYPSYMKEAELVYDEYQTSIEAKENTAKISTLEASLEELKGIVEAQAETIAKLEASPKSAEPKKKASKKDETAEDADAESEA